MTCTAVCERAHNRGEARVATQEGFLPGMLNKVGLKYRADPLQLTNDSW